MSFRAEFISIIPPYGVHSLLFFPARLPLHLLRSPYIYIWKDLRSGFPKPNKNNREKKEEREGKKKKAKYGNRTPLHPRPLLISVSPPRTSPATTLLRALPAKDPSTKPIQIPPSSRPSFFFRRGASTCRDSPTIGRSRAVCGVCPRAADVYDVVGEV
jgi:hypothetical protein